MLIRVADAAKQLGMKPAELRREAEACRCFRIVGKTNYTFEDALPLLAQKRGDRMLAYPYFQDEKTFSEVETRLRGILRQNGGPWVYFIKSGSFVKIGFATNVLRRRTDISVSCPYPLAFIGLVDPAKYSEAEVHARFGAYRHRGEWFHYVRVMWEFLREEGA